MTKTRQTQLCPTTKPLSLASNPSTSILFSLPLDPSNIVSSSHWCCAAVGPLHNQGQAAHRPLVGSEPSTDPSSIHINILALSTIVQTKPEKILLIMSTFASTSSSTSSSSRFNLDDADTRDILVYKMRAGYEISNQSQLCKQLDADPRWRCSRKAIPRGTSRLEVQTRDLFNEPERTQYAHYPNSKCSLASVGLPRGVYWRRLLLGHFEDLYILSPDSSPNSSTQNSSGGNSPDHQTPSSTWDMRREESDSQVIRRDVDI